MQASLQGPVWGEVFQFPGDGRAEGGAQATVYDAVVVGERDIHHMADNDGVAFGGFQYHGAFLYGAHGEDRDLGLVDDRGAHEAAKGADIGQGEGAALGVFGSKFVLPGIVGEGIDLAGQTGEVELFRKTR